MSRVHRTCLMAVVMAVVALALLVSAPALAEDKSCPGLDPVPLRRLLLPPPAADSKETMAELRELQDLQRLRTLDQEAHARGDHERTIARFLGEIGITVGDRPVVAIHFFKCIKHSTDNEVDSAKLRFARIRPYNLPDNRLRILKDVSEQDSPSYPSGHAAYGMVAGLLLADMLPEKRGIIIKRIEDFGYSRLLSGVHFRSDVYAGEIAGAVIFTYLSRGDGFGAKFACAKLDLRKALGYPVPDWTPAKADLCASEAK
jgi:acid phosphatase (class A)